MELKKWPQSEVGNLNKDNLPKAIDLDETVELNPEVLSDKRAASEIFEELKNLKIRKSGIINFNDIHPNDRPILEKINKEISALKLELRKRLFDLIDRHNGAYSATLDKNYSPAETKKIIEEVLNGKSDISNVPCSSILGTTKNLRDKVAELMEIWSY